MTTLPNMQRLHTKLLLLIPDIGLSGNPEQDLPRAVDLLVSGQYLKVLSLESFKSILAGEKAIEISHKYIESDGADILGLLNAISDHVTTEFGPYSSHTLVLAVLFLQMFVQQNFTGPRIPGDISPESLGFIGVLSSKAQQDADFAGSMQVHLLQALSINGLQPYSLSDSPVLLALALKLFECLQVPKVSLFDHHLELDADDLVQQSAAPYPDAIDTGSDILLAATCWWRSRALQVLQSLYPESSGVITALCLRLLSSKVVSSFIDQSDINSSLNQSILLAFHLENAKCALAGDSETQTLESLTKAEDVSGMKFVMTGCKAKRTKYQQNSVATLTVLAKSSASLLRFDTNETNGLNPQDIKLNDDTFLERPMYDTIGDAEIFETSDDAKRIKIDYSNYDASSSNDLSVKLIPTAIKKEEIPEELNALDPNNQPALASLDSIQLLLRMEALKQNTPAGSTLVNEELIALVQRVLFAPESTVNWLIFSRALWLRSLLETARSTTVERGILQLYSLTEELGMTSEQTARIFPKTDEEVQFPSEFTNLNLPDSKQLTNAVRSRFVHLLPLMPKWSVDSTLADKLVELGLFKSALEIYERLHQWTEAAVCYVTMDEKPQADKLVQKTLEENPEDARAWCVLGDIREDPSLWEKSWSLGKYPNAKKSLAKYYYKPPRDSGLEKDLEKAIGCMYDCLCSNPVSFDNWYFYGCMGLEACNFKLAAEAFRHCLTIDDDVPYAWSNLAAALIRMEEYPEAFQALGKAVNVGDTTKKSWRIWENYQGVAIKLGKWTETLNASIILLDAKRDNSGSGTLDLPVTEKLMEILVSEPYNPENLSFFEKRCIDFVCNKIPAVVSDNVRYWRDVAKVEMWRKKPWLALGDYEKAYRAAVSSPQLQIEEAAWNEAVDSCADLVSAYENLGELPGRLGAGDVVCKDWKFKSKSAIRSLIGKGKRMWEYTDGYERLQEMKQSVLHA